MRARPALRTVVSLLPPAVPSVRAPALRTVVSLLPPVVPSAMLAEAGLLAVRGLVPVPRGAFVRVLAGLVAVSILSAPRPGDPAS